MKQSLLICLLAQLIFIIKGQVTCNSSLTPRELDWDIMQADGTGVPSYNLSITWNPASLSIDVVIDLEYVGTSSSPQSSNTGLGSTYVIDFYSFGTDGSIYQIDNPGSCQNRNSTDFVGQDFDQIWNISSTPWIDANDPKYLAYPPVSSPWTISAGDSATACDHIRYSATFDFNTLQQCTDPSTGSNIMTVDNSGAESIDLGGTLYVNLISPYSMAQTASGFYRSYPLVQQDFLISINKQIDVLASTGVQLFIITIIAIFETDNGNFQMSVLTQSADYLELINPDSTGLPVQFGTYDADVSDVTSQCLVASSFTCGQIFTLEIEASEINCTESSPADFSGEYDILFEVNCKETNTSKPEGAACAAFIDDNGSPQIGLAVQSTFIDTTCVPELYSVQFSGVTTFWDDDQYTIEHNPANGAYVIGQDQIYVQVTATFPTDQATGQPFDILSIELNNVKVCTTNDTSLIALDQASGLGGCLSPNIDGDGPHNIVDNGVANPVYFAQVITGDGQAYVQYSFLTFDSARTTIQVHTQLTVVLTNGRRRMMDIVSDYKPPYDHNNNRKLLQDEPVGSNQIRSFIDSTGIAAEVVTDDNDQDDNDNIIPVNEKDTEENPGLFDGILLYIIIALIVVCMCGVAFIVMIKMKKSEKEKMETTMNTVVMTNTSTSNGTVDTKTPNSTGMEVQVNYQ